MATTKDKYHYIINPFGVEMPQAWEQPALQTITDIKRIPRVERVALSLDMTQQYKELMADPEYALKKRCETDLLWLLHWGLGFLDIDPCGRIPYQVDIAKMYQGTARRIMVIITREHFKSTFTQGYIVQELLVNPNKTFTVRCNTSRNAFYFIDVIKKRIKSPNLQMLYGNLQGDRWSGEAIDVATRDPLQATRDPNVLATGLGTDVTSLHPDEGIFDDIQSEGNYKTEEGRQLVIDDYEDMGSVIKRRKIINGTRWDDLDFYNYIIEKNKTLPPGHRDKYEILIMSVYGKADSDGKTPEEGTPIFEYSYRNDKPEKIEGVTKGMDWIDTRRFDLGPTKFANQILNHPISSRNQVFREKDFNDFDVLPDAVRKTGKAYLTIDTAGTEEKYSDFTAFIVTIVSPDYHIYVCVGKKMKIDITKNKEIIDKIFYYNELYKFEKVGIEEGVLERLFKKSIKDRQWLTNTFNFVVRKMKYGAQPGTTSPKKDERILSLQPYFEGGVIHIKKGSEMFDLRDQLIRWRPGKTSHDDLVDALAYQLQLIPRHIQREVRETAKDRFFRALDKKRTWLKHGKRSEEIQFLNEEAFHG